MQHAAPDYWFFHCGFQALTTALLLINLLPHPLFITQSCNSIIVVVNTEVSDDVLAPFIRKRIFWTRPEINKTDVFLSAAQYHNIFDQTSLKMKGLTSMHCAIDESLSGILMIQGKYITIFVITQ